MKIYCLMVLISGCAFFASAGSTNELKSSYKDSYNEAVLARISTRWILMTSSSDAGSSRVIGKVTLAFKILPDGNVADLQVVKSNVQTEEVGVCAEAILDSAPFPRWTNDPSLGYTNGFRAIRYTFNFKK